MNNFGPPPPPPFAPQSPPYAPPPYGAAGFDPANPYRAPVAPPNGLFSPSPWVSRIFLLCAISMSLGILGGVSMIGVSVAMDPNAPDPPPLAIAGMILTFVGILAIYPRIFLAMYWIYKRVDWLPLDYRRSRMWSSPISPGMAAGLLMVPYFHWFWMFAVNGMICDALDRMRLAYPTSTPPPRGLEIAACVCEIVPLGNLIVSPWLWYFYMRRVDTMMREISGRAATIAAQGWQHA